MNYLFLTELEIMHASHYTPLANHKKKCKQTAQYQLMNKIFIFLLFITSQSFLMSINGSDYQEPYVSLLEADNLASEQTSSPEKVFVKDKEEEEKTSRPYGIYLVGLSLVTILAILIFKSDSSPSYYFTYPELQYPKGREIVRSYYTKYYTDEMWILTEQFKSSISSLPLIDDQKNVVVFDLDETLIDNYRIVRKN